MKTIKTISENTKSRIKLKMMNLFKGTTSSVEVDNLSPSKAIELLRELGIEADIDKIYIDDGNFYYLIPFEYLNKNYMISGSGFYGILIIRESEDK